MIDTQGRAVPSDLLRYSCLMTPEKVLLLSGVLCLVCTPLCSQETTPRERLLVAHAQYYTPTASGLKSFHCDAAIDWKAMLTRLSGKEIPEDNPGLQFLRTVHLAINDDLRGKGSLEWSSAAALPAGREDGINQIRDGLQTSVGGFFQSWNAYMNGSMVPLPDSSVTIDAVDAGFHLSGSSKDMKIDEDFDKNMVLNQVLVVSPTIRVMAAPTYLKTEDGLIVSEIKSKMNQPPGAPETEITFHVDYARVDSYQVPSRIIFDVRNTGAIDLALSNCQVSLADWAQKH